MYAVERDRSGETDERGIGTQYEGEATSVSEPSGLPAVRPTPEDGIVRTTGRFDGTLDGDRDGERRMKRPVEELADIVGTNGRQVPMIVYRLVVGGRANARRGDDDRQRPLSNGAGRLPRRVRHDVLRVAAVGVGSGTSRSARP